MLKVSAWFRYGLAALIVAAVLPSYPVRAAVACSLGSTPHQVTTGSTTDFQFVLNNVDSDDIRWFQITVPSVSYQLVSANASGWVADVGAENITFSGGTIGSASALSFQIRVTAGGAADSPNNWYAQASDDNGGANAVYCDNNGDTTAEIVEPAGLQISNVAASDLTASSIRVSWTTDQPATSRVDYGPTASYGQSVGNGVLKTNHSVTVTGLASNQAYHYRVFSDAGGGLTATSGDNTFLTPEKQVVVVTAPPVVNPEGGAPAETVPPGISWTATLSGTYKNPPTFTGLASDNTAVVKVDYSIDGGKNWSAVDTLTARSVTTGRGRRAVTTTDARNVTFGFTPVITEDGNYEVMARATDSSGNQARTEAMTLVIDRLPPRFGGELVAFGAQPARPDAGGRWQAVVGLDQSITLNAVGGPVEVTIEAVRSDNKRVTQSFTLRRDTSNGLWRGTLSFQKMGLYELTVRAVDGAGNRVTQMLSAVNVAPAARLVSATNGTAGIGDAKVTLYFKQPGTGQWVVWDGRGFGQENPQRTDADGTFQLLVPAGTYYLRAESKGRQTLLTRQFSVDQPTPLVPTIKMTAKPHIKIGSWVLELPWVVVQREEIKPGVSSDAKSSMDLVGKPLPNFSLPSTGGTMVSPVGLLGKPTVVTVMSTWAPTTSEQLPAIVKLQKNTDVNVVPMVLGERAGRVQAYTGRTGYDVNVVIDADATLGPVLGVPSIPTHYIVDRKGIVRQVVTGVVTIERLQDLLVR